MFLEIREIILKKESVSVACREGGFGGLWGLFLLNSDCHNLL